MALGILRGGGIWPWGGFYFVPGKDGVLQGKNSGKEKGLTGIWERRACGGIFQMSLI